MNVVKKILSKTPFLHFLTKNDEIIDKPSIKLEPAIIKANVNSKGQKIAHIPGGRFYEVVKPVETFNSVEEAEKAGYRLSKQ